MSVSVVLLCQKKPP